MMSLWGDMMSAAEEELEAGAATVEAVWGSGRVMAATGAWREVRSLERQGLR